MSKKYEEMAKVLHQEAFGSDIFSLVIETKDIAKEAKAGQFVSVYSKDRSKLLPRPISLCEIDREAGTLRLVYRVTGEDTGTEEFSKLAAGDEVRILGPLGNGFAIEPGKKALLIGGGIGVPPMLQLAKDIKAGEAFSTSGEKLSALEIPELQAVMGYRDADNFLKEEFEKYCDLAIATEDGSVGTKGNVLNAIEEQKITGEVIYACGPKPMLRALKEYALSHDMECYVSMEERMACGIGACLACVCKSKDKDHHTNVNNKRICKDGPVFNAKEVEL